MKVRNVCWVKWEWFFLTLVFGGSNSFIFLQFSAKHLKNIALLGAGAPPPPRKILDPPLLVLKNNEKMKKKNYLEFQREIKNFEENNLKEEMKVVIAIVIMGEAVDLKPYEIKENVVLLDPPLGGAT